LLIKFDDYFWHYYGGTQYVKKENIMFPIMTTKAHVTRISKDGKWIVSAGGYHGEKGEISTWGCDGGLVGEIRGHRGPINGVCVSPDGTRIISGGEDMTVRVWDMATGRELHTLSGHTGAVKSVYMSPDGTRIVSGSYDDTVKVWDADTGKIIRTLTGHTSYVHSVGVSRDNAKLVTASSNEIIIWDFDDM